MKPLQEEFKAGQGIERFQEKVLEICKGDKDRQQIAEKLADLNCDYEYIISLNQELSNKYQELMDCFPTAAELAILIKNIEFEDINLKYDNKQLLDRVMKLNKFKSALISLETQNEKKVNYKYELGVDDKWYKN